MNCEECRRHLIEATSAGELPRAVRRHLEGCPDCRQKRRRIRDVDEVLTQTHVEDGESLPEPVKESTRRMILLSLEEQSAGGTESRLTPLRLAGSLLAGMVLAGISLRSLAYLVESRVLSTTAWTTCSLWWGGLFVAASALVLGGYRWGGVHLAKIATISVGSTLGVFAATYFCSWLRLLALWEASLVGRLAEAVGTAAGSHLLFGWLFALVPTLIGAILLGGDLKSRREQHGLIVGAGFLALMTPILYLQGSMMSPALGFVYILGVILGSVSGSLGGLHFRGWMKNRLSV